MAKDDALLKKLLAAFKVEAQEHLQAISSGLLALEKTPTVAKQMQLIETAFREAHSLKGAARAVNRTEIEAVCQSLESLFAAWKRQEIVPSPALFDVLYEGVDRLGELLLSPETGPPPLEKSRIKELLQRLKRALQGDLPPPGQAEQGKEEENRTPPQAEPRLPVAHEKPPLAETVRVSTAKLDSLLLQAEELLAAKLTAGQRAAELRGLSTGFAVWKKEWTKVQLEVRQIGGAVSGAPLQSAGLRGQDTKPETQGAAYSIRNPQWREFLERSSAVVGSLESKLTALAKSAEQEYRTLGRMVDNLLEDMKQVLMLPFSSLLEVFPKLVRDLARDYGKEVEVVVRGSEVETDRRILEEIKDPLIHIVRNCIDHGIEDPQRRERKKKPPKGTITIAITAKNSSRVEIRIADDGAGVDVEQVRSAALKLGLVPPEVADTLNAQEVLSLIFRSGVSTSPLITNISGRGLGLAIVREKVEKLGGTISVETSPDAGTMFRIVLPLTLARFRGVIVRVDEHLFVLPITYVERAVRLSPEEIKTVENRETIPLNGHTVALVRLAEVLELPRQSVTGAATGSVQGVVLAAADKRLAFLVDEVLNEQEVLVKSLGKQLSHLRNITGATVLGSGQVVPILNVPDLMRSAVRASVTTAQPATLPGEKKEAQRKSVLVVEDSITARTLLKHLLEAAGYAVATAVDGVDGFTQLRSGEFDLVVSDVDMPRMNGLDLTAKIRSDKKLADVPVALVTALDSRADRERGIEVGANAYIVKSSFDQSTLLEVIRRLI